MAIITMVLHNRLSLDILLAEKCGCCSECCTYILDSSIGVAEYFATIRQVVATVNKQDNEWGWHLFAWVKNSLRNIGTLMLQSLLALVGVLVTSFWLFSS